MATGGLHKIPTTASEYDKSGAKKNRCPYGAECWHIDDKKHSQEANHPSHCSDGGFCQNMEQDHLKQYRHPPLCKFATKCIEYQKHDKKHCESFRHCQRPCPYGSLCVDFHDGNHLSAEQHPFPSPCPYTPFHCPFYIELSEAQNTSYVSKKSQQHCLNFSHVCRFGRNCQNNAPVHLKTAIHIARQMCPHDGKCKKLHQDEHLNSFTHTNIADIRRVCEYAHKCRDLRKFEHTIRFRHARNDEDVGVVRCHGLNNGINFVQNHTNCIKRVLDYVKSQNWGPLPSNSIPEEILNWCRTVQPVHRCNPIVFESILLHGHAMSRDYMENLKKPNFVANSVMQHASIRRIDNLQIAQIAQHAREYIVALVSHEFEKANFPNSDSSPAPPAPYAHSAFHLKTINMKEKVLPHTISPEDLEVLKNKTIEIAQASIKLHSNPAGIGHIPDQQLGTHKHIFGVLGPHLGHYYGDVFIVFKREIIHHPDSNVYIQAATTCLSGNAFRWRPWLGADPNKEDERIKVYHSSKLHAAIPNFEQALILELMAITSKELNLKSMDMDLQTIFKRWFDTDSHRTIEAHLPELIPLDYIDHIYIPQNLYDSLSSNTKKTIDTHFKNSITITPHQGDATPEPKVFRPKPNKKERADYQDYVVDELMKMYDRNTDTSPARPIQGTVITIPGTGFNESCLLPMTISQALQQYQNENQRKPSKDVAYIYWQTINGDMMLALAGEQLNHEADQTKLRCLLCYIAPRNESHDSNYFEQATYLHCGKPMQHHVFVKKGQYTAKSNTFHVGSNTDDYITYCLELHRSDGIVVLRQVGANGIYNRQQIAVKFLRADLNLGEIEFIHAIGDTKNVSIRNLIVSFDQQMDLHPTFDKNFKKAG